MATTLQTQAARPRPRPDWMTLGSEPHARLCVICSQEAVALAPYGFGWCTAHAPLELLCP